MRALLSVRSDATPSPDAEDGASMSDTALSRRRDGGSLPQPCRPISLLCRSILCLATQQQRKRKWTERQDLPRHTDFSAITDERLRWSEQRLDDRPHKRLGFRMRVDVFFEELSNSVANQS
ncbi:hypothetical protein [Bradyrhizobium genosp. A]|uniref:hypothetical protein n=1 Tax=Bradyrhizobium genosp. A TaxID=83626 RepID=UPI003CF8DB98